MDTTDTLPLLLDSEQVASVLNIPRRRVYSLGLPVVKIGPRTYRWHRDDVLRLCSSGSAATRTASAHASPVPTAAWAQPAGAPRSWHTQRSPLTDA